MFEAYYHWVHNCPDIFHSVCRQLTHFSDESSSYTFKLGFEKYIDNSSVKKVFPYSCLKVRFRTILPAILFLPPEGFSNEIFIKLAVTHFYSWKGPFENMNWNSSLDDQLQNLCLLWIPEHMILIQKDIWSGVKQ